MYKIKFTYISFIFFVLFIFLKHENGSAQTGIGNILPDTVNSILDLRNANNKSLRSPNAPGFYPSTPSGLLFFVNAEEKLFYNETSAGNYNGLAPWRYKFGSDTTFNTYISTSGYVGIGKSDPQRPLHLYSTTSPTLLLEGTNSSYIKLYTTTGNTTANIGFQNSSDFTISNSKPGGKIEINVNNGGKFNVEARIKENNNTLVPTGTIAFWYGPNTSVPGGWAICDGGSYPKTDGTGNISTPNLTNKFVIGAGDDYNLNATGGSATVSLTNSNQMPNHRHDVSNYATENTGSHTHRIPSDGGSTHSNGSYLRRDDGYNGTGTTTGPIGTGMSGGVHTHTVTGNTGSTGSSAPMENMPPYMCIRYIMKL